MVNEVLDNGGQVLCKPWAPRNGELFAKSAFKIDMRSRHLACPADRGGRKNTFDLRRAASIQNIESWQRHLERSSLNAG